jgi:hypothetical protein
VRVTTTRLKRVAHAIPNAELRAPAEIARIFVQQGCQHGVLKEILRRDVGHRRAKPLGIRTRAVPYFGLSLSICESAAPAAAERTVNGSKVSLANSSELLFHRERRDIPFGSSTVR